MPPKKGDFKKGLARKKMQKLFLEAYAETYSISAASKRIGIERNNHFNWIKRDPEYRKAFEETKDRAVEVLEAEAVRRAHEGWLEPVFYRGEVVGEVRRFSDTMTIFLLKAAKPEVYRDDYKPRVIEGEITLKIIREDSKPNGD